MSETPHPYAEDRTPAALVSFGVPRRRYVGYLLWALVIPAIVWSLAFPLVTSRSYEDWGETQYGPVLEFPYQRSAPNADVVIFGDSSAFLGIDPRQINAALGVRSVVLPSTVGSLPVVGDAPLRSYLSMHSQPRLIVLYFSPWNLNFAHAAPGRLFEGEEMMLRHGTAGEIVRFALRHPVELLAFPIRMYSTFGLHMLLAVLHHHDRVQDTAAGLGHTPYLEPFPPLQDLCRIPPEFLKTHGDASVEALRQRYTRPGTAVMVYLAPVPACTNSGAVQNPAFAALNAAAPRQLPPTDFAGDPYYAHIRPPYVATATALLTQAVKAELEGLGQSPATASR